MQTTTSSRALSSSTKVALLLLLLLLLLRLLGERPLITTTLKPKTTEGEVELLETHDAARKMSKGRTVDGQVEEFRAWRDAGHQTERRDATATGGQRQSGRERKPERTGEEKRTKKSAGGNVGEAAGRREKSCLPYETEEEIEEKFLELEDNRND